MTHKVICSQKNTYRPHFQNQQYINSYNIQTIWLKFLARPLRRTTWLGGKRGL